MKNRAKCKLCESIIESFHAHDYVTCKCGEIAVGGDDGLYPCAAKNWGNFLRVDDEGNTIVPTIKTKDDVKQLDIEEKEAPKPTRNDLIKMLDDMVKSIEQLPPNAMTTYVNQYDLMSFMMIMSAIFKAKE